MLEGGLMDRENNRPMARDTICRLYSQTKPITAAAIMLLMERGVIDLFDPVEKFLPGFAHPRVAEGGKLIPADPQRNDHGFTGHDGGHLLSGRHGRGGLSGEEAL